MMSVIKKLGELGVAVLRDGKVYLTPTFKSGFTTSVMKLMRNSKLKDASLYDVFVMAVLLTLSSYSPMSEGRVVPCASFIMKMILSSMKEIGVSKEQLRSIKVRDVNPKEFEAELFRLTSASYVA
jgi:hypothetical protein